MQDEVDVFQANLLGSGILPLATGTAYLSEVAYLLLIFQPDPFVDLAGIEVRENNLRLRSELETYRIASIRLCPSKSDHLHLDIAAYD